MSIIHNKNSIYEGYEFQPAPFESNDKFSVFIPKERDTVSHIIKKSQDPKFRLNAFRSPFYSPQQTHEKFFPVQNSEGSRFREKLQGDIEKAKEYEKEGNKAEGKPHEEKNECRHAQVTEPEQVQQGITGSVLKTETKSSAGKKKVTIQQLADAKKIQKFKDSLYFDERTKTLPKTTLKNKVVEDLVNQYDSVIDNRNLLDYIYKIKGQSLLKNQRIKVEKSKGHGKFNFVYNDYHLKETNPGFARNTLGTFFTR